MGSKGGTSVQNYERELSAEELQLLETQNTMLNAGIGIAEEQEARSADQYAQWQSTYEPIETGLMGEGATRASGYYSGGGLFQAPPPPTQAPTQAPEATRLNPFGGTGFDKAKGA